MIEIRGLDETIAALQGLPASLGVATAFDEAGQFLSAIVRDATPAGYTGRLPDSVVYESSESGLTVGYEQGVATAGEDKWDSVVRPRTRGRSVIRRRWVRRDELPVILAEAVEGRSQEALEIIERSVARGLS
jgi:hypothetical protein